MDNIKNVLQELISIYRRSIGAGHTYAMLKGAENSEQCKVVCRTYDHAMHLGLNPKKFLILDNPDKLKGISACLAFDNTTLQMLFEKSLNAIIKGERRIAELEKPNQEKPL